MTRDSRQRGSDPLGEFQRWLMRSGAREFGREVRGNVRRTFGYGNAGRDDVWESATNEPPGGEPPECEWCPLCRAARKFRDAEPGLGSHLSSAGGIFATVVQDAVGAFENLIAAMPNPGARADDAGPDRQPRDAREAGEVGEAGPDRQAGDAREAGEAGPDRQAGDAREAGEVGEAAPAPDEPATTGDGPATADTKQQAGTGERQERPTHGLDDRG